MLLRCAVGGLMLLFVQAGNAEEVPEHTFTGDISFGANLTSGNTDTDNFDGNLDLAYNYQKWASTFSFKASQTKESGVLTSDYYEAFLRGSYDLPYQLYTVLQLGYRQDEFGGIYSEKSYVVGLGYHAFIDEPMYSLDFELGLGERVTKKLINGVIRDRVDYDPGTHIALMGEYVFDDENKVDIKVSGEFGNDDDFLLREIAWVHHLFDHFNIEFSHEERKITKPEAGILPTDTRTSVKLGYNF